MLRPVSRSVSIRPSGSNAAYAAVHRSTVEMQVGQSHHAIGRSAYAWTRVQPAWTAMNPMASARSDAPDEPAGRVGEDHQREQRVEPAVHHGRQERDDRDVRAREVADEPREPGEDRERPDPVSRAAVRDDQAGRDHRPADGDVGEEQRRTPLGGPGELVGSERPEDERDERRWPQGRSARRGTLMSVSAPGGT